MKKQKSNLEKEFDAIIAEHRAARSSLIEKLEKDPENESLRNELISLCEKTGLPARYVSSIYPQYSEYIGEYNDIVWDVYVPTNFDKFKSLRSSFWQNEIEYYDHESYHEPGKWSTSSSC